MIFRAKKNNWPLITEEFSGDSIAKDIDWNKVDPNDYKIHGKQSCIVDIRGSFRDVDLDYDSFLFRKTPVKQIFKVYREEYKKKYGREL